MDLSKLVQEAELMAYNIKRKGRQEITDTLLGKCCICSKCGSCTNIEYRYCPYCGEEKEGEITNE